jgi:hypothetical protein
VQNVETRDIVRTNVPMNYIFGIVFIYVDVRTRREKEGETDKTPREEITVALV